MSNQDLRKLMKAFTHQYGTLVITNYRIVFVPTVSLKDANFEKYMTAQPRFVHEFFNLPIGLINRLDR
jgi:hypothetical protein